MYFYRIIDTECNFKNFLTGIIKSITATVIIHLYFLAGIFIYKVYIKNDKTHDYIEITKSIYYAYWLPILLVSIFLICGFTYNFYNNINDKIISKMAKANEQKVKE